MTARLNISEVRKLLMREQSTGESWGPSERTVYDMCRKQKLPGAINIDGRWQVDEAVLRNCGRIICDLQPGEPRSTWRQGAMPAPLDTFDGLVEELHKQTHSCRQLTGEDHTLRVWDRWTGDCLATLEGHTDSVVDVLVLEDKRIVSWSRDGTLRVWNASSGSCLATCKGHSDIVWGAVDLKDGRVLSWSDKDDPTLRVWNTSTGDCLATFDAQAKDALLLYDGNILSWWGSVSAQFGFRPNPPWYTYDSHTLHMWDPSTGVSLGCWKEKVREEPIWENGEVPPPEILELYNRDVIRNSKGSPQPALPGPLQNVAVCLLT